MADTLTIKQDDQSTDVENLTTEEQDSLQVGEEMAKEQGELLAGKYKSAEDLEKLTLNSKRIRRQGRT